MSEIQLVQATAGSQNAAQIRKSPHLIVIKNGNKKQLFISLDAPILLQNFVHAKGIFTDYEEADIPQNYVEVLTNNSSELVCEMWFSAHTVTSMRSLIFKAKTGK